MTKYIGEYSYVITPDCCARVYKNNVFKWQSEPCESRFDADDKAKNWINAASKGNVTLEVKNLIVDPDTLFGGKYHV